MERLNQHIFGVYDRSIRTLQEHMRCYKELPLKRKEQLNAVASGESRGSRNMPIRQRLTALDIVKEEYACRSPMAQNICL